MSSSNNSHAAGGAAPVGSSLVRQRPPAPATGTLVRSDTRDAPASASQRATTLLAQKRYFRIGEVAEAVGVEPHVLRYWEREFRAIRPTKSARGQRVYSRSDVVLLLRVKELLYGEGYTIAGARKKIAGKGALENLDSSRPSVRETEPARDPLVIPAQESPSALAPPPLIAAPPMSRSPLSGEGVRAPTFFAGTLPGSEPADAHPIGNALDAPPGGVEAEWVKAETTAFAARKSDPKLQPKAQRHVDPNVARRLGEIRAELEAFLSELGGA